METERNNWGILLEATSPCGGALAVVEQDAACCYFYLYAEGAAGARSCWVRNLKPASSLCSHDRRLEGLAPLLPPEHCCHPEGAPPLRRESLRVVWSEATTACLYEGDEWLAEIPGSSSQTPGYARDCLGRTEVCWERPVSSRL